MAARGDEARTTATIALLAVGLVLLAQVAHPMTATPFALVAACALQASAGRVS